MERERRGSSPGLALSLQHLCSTSAAPSAAAPYPPAELTPRTVVSTPPHPSQQLLAHLVEARFQRRQQRVHLRSARPPLSHKADQLARRRDVLRVDGPPCWPHCPRTRAECAGTRPSLLRVRLVAWHDHACSLSGIQSGGRGCVTVAGRCQRLGRHCGVTEKGRQKETRTTTQQQVVSVQFRDDSAPKVVSCLEFPLS